MFAHFTESDVVVPCALNRTDILWKPMKPLLPVPDAGMKTENFIVSVRSAGVRLSGTLLIPWSTRGIRTLRGYIQESSGQASFWCSRSLDLPYTCSPHLALFNLFKKYFLIKTKKEGFEWFSKILYGFTVDLTMGLWQCCSQRSQSEGDRCAIDHPLPLWCQCR